MTRRSLIFLIALLFVAVRLPSLVSEVRVDELQHAGAARHLVLHGDRRPEGLVSDGVLASHVGSPIAWALNSPAPEWDVAGPGDQPGRRMLYTTRTPTDDVVPAPLVALAARLPFLILGVLALALLVKLASRFYDRTTGVVAAALVTGSAGLATLSGAAVPAALALPVMALLLVAFDDHVHTLQYDGRPPKRLFRARTLTCAMAVTVALATSFAFVPIVIAGLLFLVVNRRAVRAREERVHSGVAFRALTGGLVVAFLLTFAYGLDFGAPLSQGSSHPALRTWAAGLGLDEAAIAGSMADWRVPLPTWFRGLAHAGMDAHRSAFDDRLAVVVGVDAPLLAALALCGLAAWPILLRDRTDTPSLLGVLGYSALAASLVLAPRHAEIAALAAIPPLAILTSAWLTRLSRHFRTGAVVVGVALTATLAAGWVLAARGPFAPPPEMPAPARATAADEWVAARWIEAHEPETALTILGREPRTRIIGKARIEELPADELEAALDRMRSEPDVAVIRARWLPRPAEWPDDIRVEALGPRLEAMTYRDR